MMGQHDGQAELFSYEVNLERRVRADHPLRAIRAAIDFTFVREEVAHCYGRNGNESVDPAVIMKLMFVLFFDNVKSERELMRMLPERLDYLWFLGFGLDDEVPDHSVLSKARARWGQAVFESLFVRTVQQCVQAGLVDGSKLHLDGSLINAHASKDSVIKSSPELIAALKRAYQAEERKLEGDSSNPYYKPVNARLCSTTDPDAPCVRHNRPGDSRPRYKQHRAVDDRCGVVTAVITTAGDVAEPTQTLPLVDQHTQNTGRTTTVLVADRQYGSVENYRQLQVRGLLTHIAPAQSEPASSTGIYPAEAFTYHQSSNTYHCPAGQTLYPWHWNPRRQATEYHAKKGVCLRCPLREACTRSRTGRTLHRNDGHELIERAKRQGLSATARASRRRRQHLMEGSFAQAANQHGFKRSRWRRLWRQQIQDWLIAACQNLKLLVRTLESVPAAASPRLELQFGSACSVFAALSFSMS
jgi:transposase